MHVAECYEEDFGFSEADGVKGIVGVDGVSVAGAGGSTPRACQ